MKDRIITNEYNNYTNRYGKWRHEYKYVIDSVQEQCLLVRCRGILQKDKHVMMDGSYIVRSLYFDDPYNVCAYENINGTDPRAKYRIRYYNTSLSRIVLEKKIKKRGMCLKQSCSLSIEEVECLINGKSIVINDSMEKIKQKLLSEIITKDLKPKTIVTYERIPFIYPAGNVRVTFDKCISSSTEIKRFLTANYMQRPVLPLGRTILEVKWDEFLPDYIRELVEIEKLEWGAFSKYFSCFKCSL